MPLLRTPTGGIVSVPADEADTAEAGGYTRVDLGQAGATAAAPASEDRGVLGGINAAATSLLSGATLGLSDYALKGTLDQGKFSRLAQEREGHPIASGIGQVAGAILPSIAAPESLLGRAPAGIVGHATADAVAAGRAIGGAEGVARQLAAAGVEGAIQNAGMCLSDTALGDRDLSAEGLAGALGPGFAFGLGGGAAALGIEQGTIAARRLFSRAAGTDKAAQAAESAWKEQYQAHVEASDAASDIAKAKLAEAKAAREQAQLAKQRALAAQAEAKARPMPAQVVEPPEVPAALPPAGAAAPAGIDWGAVEQSAAMSPEELAAQRSSILSKAAEDELAGAVADHAIARADLEDMLRRLEAPAIEPGVVPSNIVPMAEFGAPGMRGYDPGNVRAPGPPSAVEAVTGDVTAVGKKRIAQGTPVTEGHALGGVVEPSAAPSEKSLPGNAKITVEDHGDQVDVHVHAAGGGRGRLTVRKTRDGTWKVSDVGLDDALQGKGIGTSMYSRAAQHIEDAHGQQLYSDYTRTPEAERMWQGLEKKGLARRIPDPENPGGPPEQWVFEVRPGAKSAPSGSLERQYEGIKVKRVGRPSERKFEIHGPDGVTPIDRGDLNKWLDEQMPAGFGPGSIETHRDFSIEHGVPASPDKIAENAIYIVRPSELADHGILGNKIRPDDLKRGAEGFANSKVRFNPVEVDMAPNGELWIRDGNHRILNAADGDRPMAVKFWRVSGTRAEENAAGRTANVAGDPDIDVAPRIRERLAKSAPVAATDTLTGQLRGMQERLSAGESLGEISGSAPRTAKGAPAPTGAGLESTLRATSDRLAAGEPISAISDAAPLRKSYVVSKQLERGIPLSDPAAVSRVGSDPESFFAALTKPRTRDAYVAANIGRAWREEGSHAAALAKVEREWAAMAGHPMAPAGLEAAHDAAVQRAAAATSPAEQLTAEHEIQVIERQMTAVGKRPGAVEDVAAVAEVATKYEKASARLTEALGPDAPPAAQEAAKAFRAAEDASDRKAMDRTTRAIDDHAEAQAKRDVVVTRRTPGNAGSAAAPDWLDEARKLSGKRTPEQLAERDRQFRRWELDAAKGDVQRADVGLSKARVAETEASIGARGAGDAAAKARAAMDAARPAAASEASGGSRLGAIATTIGVAGELGVPGIPKPHEIPVIGPLLSTYLKYRAIKAAAGRFMGRIPATGDARAAALVARTKDRIVKAVDRTLGLAEAAAPKARGVVVAAATVLGHRAFDDGEPDAPKGATTQQLAAVRIREIANAATRPDLVTALVRKELSGVTDPDLIDAAEKHLIARYQWLNSVMPKAPAPNPYTLAKWVPTQGQAHEVAQRLAVVNDPESAFVDTTPAKADTLRNVSPKLLELAQQRLLDRVSDIKSPVPYQQRLRGSRLFGVQLDDSLDPQAIAIMQAAHAANRASPTPQPASPPTSSIAADTHLNTMYQTGMDRRAMR